MFFFCEVYNIFLMNEFSDIIKQGERLKRQLN